MQIYEQKELYNDIEKCDVNWTVEWIKINNLWSQVWSDFINISFLNWKNNFKIWNCYILNFIAIARAPPEGEPGSTCAFLCAVVV